jgi:CheY-like chemotaxis protein
MAAAQCSRTILLIDDDDDYREALALMFEVSGYRVRSADNGLDGVRMAAEEPPDAILVDFLMPVMNGPETSRRLRALSALRDVPILALTAFGRRPDEMDGAGLGFSGSDIQGYLEKAAEPEALIERVASAIAARASAQGLEHP